jgi:hypothetical protein
MQMLMICSIIEGERDRSMDECIATTEGLHCAKFESGSSVLK